ncbi:hypothetical protein QPX96_02860 [Limosilactobacillus fermentum]|nr:hypothetical protein [Limosilactobacillus fermentum]
MRYVDDMYIKIPKKLKNKDVNEIIRLISSELWKNGLNLNSKKTNLYSIKKYKEEVNFSKNINSSSNISGVPFLEPPYIKNRIDELLDNDGDKLTNFLYEVKCIYEKKAPI